MKTIYRRLCIIFAIISAITSVILIFSLKADYAYINLFISLVMCFLVFKDKANYRIYENLFSTVWFSGINIISIIYYIITGKTLFSINNHIALIYGLYILLDIIISNIFANKKE